MSILLKRRGSVRTVSGKITKDNLPKFVKFEGSGGAMRLRYGYEYYRDGGDWSVSFKIENGKLTVDEPSGPMAHMNHCELTEISYEEWREGNSGYAPSRRYVEDEFEEAIGGGGGWESDEIAF